MLSTHDILVLALISDQPAHGYELRQQLDSGYLAHCARISTPQIYSVLRRLAERGLVSAKEERNGNAPPRTVYKIEQRGREALLQIIKEQPAAREDSLFAFDIILSAMAHVQVLSKAECLSVVTNRMRMVENQLADCQEASKSLGPNDLLPGLTRAVHDHRSQHLQCEMQWLKGLERRIREKGWQAFVSGANRTKRLNRKAKKTRKT